MADFGIGLGRLHSDELVESLVSLLELGTLRVREPIDGRVVEVSHKRGASSAPRVRWLTDARAAPILRDLARTPGREYPNEWWDLLVDDPPPDLYVVQDYDCLSPVLPVSDGRPLRIGFSGPLLSGIQTTIADPELADDRDLLALLDAASQCLQTCVQHRLVFSLGYS